MTREEIHAKVNAEGNISKANVIDFMWEHFQSRTCENCKFVEDISTSTRYLVYACNNTDNMYMTSGSDMKKMKVKYRFSCNKFERKKV